MIHGNLAVWLLPKGCRSATDWAGWLSAKPIGGCDSDRACARATAESGAAVSELASGLTGATCRAAIGNLSRSDRQLVAYLPANAGSSDEDKKRLTKCPICKGDLYDYSIMGISKITKCYCPECDIVRQYMMSMPFLCSRCYSRSFYEKDGRHYCWFCGNDEIIGIKYEDAKEQGLFDTEGFKLSGIFIDRKNDECRHENNKNKRHNDIVFKFICGDCGYIEYIMVPKRIQDEQNIKDKIRG